MIKMKISAAVSSRKERETEMLKGKTILLGVSGGIAAYKSVALASLLVKQGADVHVIMTENAQKFVGPISFEGITKNRCVNDVFDRGNDTATEHITLAKMADAFIVAPATANMIAKLANGIADDMLSTTFLASYCPKIVSPAMNTHMYENQATQNNLEILKSYGVTIAEADSGWLACGDVGKGRMPEADELLDYVLMACACEKDLAGKKLLVTAGPTIESIDPVRYISNHSSGKMGYSVAKLATLRGAEVTLVSGETDINPPRFVNFVKVKSAGEMFEAVTSLSADADIIVKAAAVADYRPKTVAENKIKKGSGEMVIELERTSDILMWLGEHKRDNQFICGFAMETEKLLERAAEKLERKNADLIVANNLKDSGAGFGTNTNLVSFVSKDGCRSLELMSKDEVAGKLLDEILYMMSNKEK